MTTTPVTLDFRLATPRDRASIATTLSAAFHDDPVFQWCVPDDTHRAAALPGVFGAIADGFVPLGSTRVTADATGAALWAPPGTAADVDADAMRAALAPLPAGDAARFEAVVALLDAHHPHEPCWHLQFVGVRPERQGRGVGGALLRGVLDRLDEDAAPAYLEATSEHNRRLYARHGFRVVQELRVADSPPLWAMWRDPRAA
jgi:ribosomal protein S18 acetylase RimI-like enzyme